jgi:hypothetical protein
MNAKEHNQKEEFKDTTSFGIYGFPTFKSTEDVENNQFYLMLDCNGVEPNFNNMTKNWFVIDGINEDAYRNKLISVTKENIFYLIADVDKFIQNNISLVSKCYITNYLQLLLFAMNYLKDDENYSITKLFYWQKLKEYLPTLTKRNKITLVYEYTQEIKEIYPELIDEVVTYPISDRNILWIPCFTKFMERVCEYTDYTMDNIIRIQCSNLPYQYFKYLITDGNYKNLSVDDILLIARDYTIVTKQKDEIEKEYLKYKTWKELTELKCN